MSAQELLASKLGVDVDDSSVLSDISLRARAGLPVAITGPSGSGKTVLLHALAGLTPASRGDVFLDDVPLSGEDPLVRRRFGVVLQSHGLASGLTAEENVALPLQARALPKEIIAARCSIALTSVGLDDATGRLVDELSGGQRQRVGIARALAGQPDVLVADEPTAELDPLNRTRMLSLLLDPEAQRIVLIASNDPELLDACHEVVHLLDGRIVDLR
jgi:putative ABC transport system ATP-binding protein